MYVYKLNKQKIEIIGTKYALTTCPDYIFGLTGYYFRVYLHNVTFLNMLLVLFKTLSYLSSRIFVGVNPKAIRNITIATIIRKGMNEHSTEHVPGMAIPSGTQAQSINMELCKEKDQLELFSQTNR